MNQIFDMLVVIVHSLEKLVRYAPLAEVVANSGRW